MINAEMDVGPASSEPLIYFLNLTRSTRNVKSNGVKVQENSLKEKMKE